MVKVEEIKMYAITQKFKTNAGTSAFAGHIFATSFAEAEKLCEKIGATLDGEMVESQCAGCGHTETFNESDEWADMIEDK